jgi:serine/threonine protein kinase
MGNSSRHAGAASPSAAGAPFARFTRVDALPPGSSGESFLVERGGERFVLKAIAGPRLEAQRLRMLDESEALAQFAQPAGAGSRARGPAGVAPFVEVELRPDGRLHLLRRFVEGETLAARIERRRPPLADALALARATLRVLVRLHAAGVVHRNLKPSNVIVGEDGSVTLVDVGMSHDLSVSGEGSDSLARLARYVSPEQAGLVYQGVQEATDLYLFGLVLYEMLAGVPAYDGGTFGEVLRRHLTAPAPSAHASGLRVPRALDDVIARLLRKDPRDRYRTAAGVLADLDDVAERLAAGEKDPELVVGAYDRRERLTEPGFIGRTRELTALTAAVEDARRGTGSLVCLEAESGGGKTRLLDELARRAEQRG